MRRYLLASSAALALSAPAMAEDISTARTTPVRTSTVANGAPAAINITATGSVTVTSGTAVTMDSNHAVTNKGAIKVTSASDGGTGILATAGTSGDIINTGTIAVEEPYTPTDTDNDGDIDGPFALGSGRFGIRTLGAHAGKIESSGTISVEGNDSAGIWLGGPLTGAFTHSGTTGVLGNNSTGVHLGDVTGNVRLAGTVNAKGAGAVAAELTGDVNGTLVVQGTIASSGYRAPTPPANTTKLDADDLLQGGSALVIEGNVTGGIVLAAAPKDADPANADEDSDGLPDATEGTAAVASFGAAPAMVIGTTGRNLTIGPVASTASKFGMQIDGSVKGSGVYAGVDGNGLVIGGQGGGVTITNGMSISGVVGAASNGANATALRLGAGAATPELRVSGTVEAAGGNAATAFTTAIRIDAGAALPTIRNSGTIKATAAGTNGNATAIIDMSGGLTLVENSGTIAATGAAADSTRNIAIDLSANTSGAIVRQTQVGTGFTAPSIKGDIRFGTGNDTLDLADGSMTGAAYFGTGADRLVMSGDAVHTGRSLFGAGDDLLSLAGTSVFNGVADFGGGADSMVIADSARFAGALANAGGLAINMTGGVFAAAGTAAFGSLAVAKDATLFATLDKDAGEGSFYNIAGTATFATGAKLAVQLADVENAEGRYQVLSAGTVQGAAGITLVDALIPFMFKATVATNAAPNTIAVDIARRSASDLGLNASQGAALNAVLSALGEDEVIEDVFLGINNGDLFRSTIRQMLPDHAGGAFEGISLGTRTLARPAGDHVGPIYSWGGFDVIVNGAAWTSTKDEGATAAYDLDGMGLTVAGELDLTTLGTIGVSLGWIWNSYDQGNDLTSVQSDAYEAAAYWRGEWGGFTGFARGSIGKADFHGRRTFRGMDGANVIDRSSTGEWGGQLMTLSGGASYELGGGTFFVRPSVTADYLKLSEDGYTDTGGGDALDLIVDARDSDELAVNGGLALGIDFVGNGPRDERWFRVEGEGGWREVVNGNLGATTARFEDGTPFTLAPEQHASGWFARLRALGGSDIFEFGGEAGAEDRHGNTALSLRGTLRLGF